MTDDAFMALDIEWAAGVETFNGRLATHHVEYDLQVAGNAFVQEEGIARTRQAGSIVNKSTKLNDRVNLGD